MRIAGPMQAWGASSRFTRRTTRSEPTKSGIIGLLAAASGRRRTDPIEDLVNMRFAVRTDQPGRLLRDFQTTRSLDGQHAFPLSTRYYLEDAVFVAAMEGDTGLVEGLAHALSSPGFPLYLGRRSCPPSRPVLIGIDPDRALLDALAAVPWQATDWWRRRTRSETVLLEVTSDTTEAREAEAELVQDVPLSFDPERRDYAWRSVTRGHVEVTNDLATTGVTPRRRTYMAHDPFAALGGG